MRTVKHILSRVIFLCCSLLLLNTSVSHAAEIDSVWFHQLVDKATVSLRNTILRNEELKAQGREREMNFVVAVEDGEPVGPYLIDVGIDGKKSALAEFESQKGKLEDRLKAIYGAERVEAYVLMLNCFDVKVNRPLPDEISVETLFSAKNSDATNIPDLQRLHDLFTQAVSSDKKLFRDNAARILLSTGIYRIGRRDSQGNPVSDNYYYFKPTPNPANKLATENIVPLLYRYLRENDPKDGSALQFADFQVSSLEKAIHSSKYKARILDTYEVDEMIEILKNFASSVDYKGLSLEERIHIISVLLTKSLHGNYGVFDNAEGAVMKIFRTVPSEQIEGFFAGLERPSPFAGDSIYHEITKKVEKNTYPLINRLLDEMDDALLFAGGNNYTDLIVAVRDLLIQSPRLPDRAKALASDPEVLLRHCIKWKGGAAYLPGDRQYTIKLLETGKVQVETRVVLETHQMAINDEGSMGSSWTNYVPGSEQTDIFSPFELIGFNNLSTQSFLNPLTGAENDSMAFMPAIFLDYAIKKKANMDLEKAAFMMLDVATLATGYGGFVTAVSDIRKAIVLFNVATATMNLTANTFEEQLKDTRFHEVVEATNALMMVVGVTELARSGPRTLATALKVSKKIAQVASKEVALRFVAAVMRAETELKAARLGTKAADDLLALRNEIVTEWHGNYKTELAEDLRDLEAKMKGEAPKSVEETPKPVEEAPKTTEEAPTDGHLKNGTPPLVIEESQLHSNVKYLGVEGGIKQCVYKTPDGQVHTAKRVYIDAKSIKSLESEVDLKEILFAEKIAEFINDDIVIPEETEFPAIDGIGARSGTLLTFKEVNGTTAENIKKLINKAYTAVVDNNKKSATGFVHKGRLLEEYKNVKCYVEGSKVVSTKEQVNEMWSNYCRNPQNFKNDGLIDEIIVYLTGEDPWRLDFSKFKPKK